jgi:hypothetical protein
MVKDPAVGADAQRPDAGNSRCLTRVVGRAVHYELRYRETHERGTFRDM